ncbi:CBS domain-containing protein [Bacillus sp. 179-C3.3 HS]|uniref:CBS domain-containing protein n=1 Tax=Bacillus sp. 179-C3.3 HS TaxID=3232162 RepID=UPI00399F58D8
MKTKKIKDIMTKKVITCQKDDNVYEAAVKMKTADIGAIPIVEGDQLVGIVTDRDLVLRGIAEKKPNSQAVSNVMTKEVLTAEEDATLEEIVRLMSEYQLRRIPVVKGGTLTGIVALGDLSVEDLANDRAGDALTEISQQDRDHGQGFLH